MRQDVIDVHDFENEQLLLMAVDNERQFLFLDDFIEKDSIVEYAGIFDPQRFRHLQQINQNDPQLVRFIDTINGLIADH